VVALNNFEFDNSHISTYTWSQRMTESKYNESDNSPISFLSKLNMQPNQKISNLTNHHTMYTRVKCGAKHDDII